MHVGGYKLCTCVWLDALRLTHVSGSLRLFAAEPALRNTESVDHLTNRSFFSLQASGVKEPSVGKLLQEQKVKATYALNKWVEERVWTRDHLKQTKAHGPGRRVCDRRGNMDTRGPGAPN